MDWELDAVAVRRRPCFLLGKVHLTPPAKAALNEARPPLSDLLALHMAGVGGDVGDERLVWNERACEAEEEIVSAYTLSSGAKVWLVTDGERQFTAVFLASEVC